MLGLLQGLTEFFPVSSSGHLVLAEATLGVNPPGVFFEVMVHLATVVAVLVLYRRRIIEILVGAVGGEMDAWRYVGMLALATVPAAIVGSAMADTIAEVFDRPMVAAANLLVTGLIVFATRWLVGRGERRDPGWAGSFGVGVAQAAALLPGISRSGATVTAALWARTGRHAAAEFSFLLSIPVILGASALELIGFEGLSADIDAVPLAAAALSAFGAGVVAIRLFVRWLNTGRFYRFAYYAWAVGGGYLVYGFLTR